MDISSSEQDCSCPWCRSRHPVLVSAAPVDGAGGAHGPASSPTSLVTAMLRATADPPVVSSIRRHRLRHSLSAARAIVRADGTKSATFDPWVPITSSFGSSGAAGRSFVGMGGPIEPAGAGAVPTEAEIDILVVANRRGAMDEVRVNMNHVTEQTWLSSQSLSRLCPHGRNRGTKETGKSSAATVSPGGVYRGSRSDAPGPRRGE